MCRKVFGAPPSIQPLRYLFLSLCFVVLVLPLNLHSAAKHIDVLDKIPNEIYTRKRYVRGQSPAYFLIHKWYCFVWILICTGPQAAADVKLIPYIDSL